MKTAPKNTANEKKPDVALIPFDLLIEYLPAAYSEGLIKYYRESWRKGFKTSDMFSGTIRHLNQYFYKKEDYDKESEELGIKKHHLAGALFCILCMLDTFQNHPELDDRGKDYEPEGWGPEMMLNQIEEAKKRRKNG